MYKLNLSVLIAAIYDNMDAAIEAGWTPKMWEGVGLETLAKRRIRDIEDLRLVFASLGARQQILNLTHLAASDTVEIVNDYAEGKIPQ